MTVKNEVEVSILCITYNHAEFIKKALDGFLMQKTTFNYEIVIHDDASTDGTTEILLDYQKKYPDKIRLLLEDENQYSKGIRILPAFMLSEIRGKYAAVSDGDDEWIYDGKLQQQYDFMERNPEITLCTHNAIKRDLERQEETYLVNGLEEGIVSDEEIILYKKGHMPTTSYFFRAECIENYPSYCYDAPVGDDPLRHHLACKGKIYYMDKVWAIRNYMHKGAWNDLMREIDFSLMHIKRFLKYVGEFDRYSQRRFHTLLMELGQSLCLGAVDKLLQRYNTIKELKESVSQYCEETGHEYDAYFEAAYHVKVAECVDYCEQVIVPYVDKAMQAGGKLYIYGAGIYAQKRALLLEQNKIEYAGFVVSGGQQKENEYMGHKVYSLHDLKEPTEKVFFWLGLGVKNRGEVLQILKELGYNNVL